MASQNRIDSVYDVAKITAEQQEVEELVRASIEQIKQARTQSIDFNVNTKSIADYNTKVNELNASIANMKNTVAATTVVTQANTQATQQANGTLEQQIELRKRLETRIKSLQKDLKEDEALLKSGVLTQGEYKKRLTENTVSLEQYNAKLKEVNKSIKDSFPTQKQQEVELRRQQKAADDAGNEYKQLSAAYNEAALKAKNYQLALGATNPITIEAVKNAKGLSDQLKKVDAAVGQNQRSVGDYQNAITGAFSKIWSGLRTAANIIPGLGIGGLIGGIVASIGNLAASVASAAKPFKELKEANEALNTTMSQSKYTDTVAEVKTLKTEIQLAKDGFLDKNEVVEHYNETIGKTTGEVKTLNEAEQALNKNAEAYIRFTLLKAAANEVQQRAAKELVEAEIQNQKDLARIQKITTTDDEGIGEFIKRGEENLRKAEQAAATKRVKGLENIADKFLREAAQLSKQFNFNFFEDDDKKTKERTKKSRDLAEANAKAEFEILKSQLELNKEFDLRRANDQKRTYEDRLMNLINYGESSRALIEAQATFELRNAELTAKEREKIENDKNNNLIRLSVELGDKLKAITANNFKTNTDQLSKSVSGKIPKELQKILDDFDKAQKKAIDKAAKDIEAFKQEMKSALATLASELEGLFFDIFTNQIERQKNAIQDQIDLLEQQKQKDIELADQTITNAQEKADAIAVIEARAQTKREALERRQRQLDVQKARFEKARAITEIIQSTSLAVMKALAEFPGPAGIALAAVVGAIGAVQLARAIAQPIPKYAQGTDNHPGGLAIVGDGGKSETVVLPDGSLYRTPSKDTLVNMPAGSQVIPDYIGKPQNLALIQPVDNTDRLMAGFGEVVKAVKKIPQPIIRADRAWTEAHRQGSNFRSYLNRYK